MADPITDPKTAALIEKEVGASKPVTLQEKVRVLGIQATINRDGSYYMVVSHTTTTSDGVTDYRETSATTAIEDAQLGDDAKKAIDALITIALGAI